MDSVAGKTLTKAEAVAQMEGISEATLYNWRNQRVNRCPSPKKSEQ